MLSLIVLSLIAVSRTIEQRADVNSVTVASRLIRDRAVPVNLNTNIIQAPEISTNPVPVQPLLESPPSPTPTFRQEDQPELIISSQLLNKMTSENTKTDSRVSSFAELDYKDRIIFIDDDAPEEIRKNDKSGAAKGVPSAARSSFSEPFTSPVLNKDSELNVTTPNVTNDRMVFPDDDVPKELQVKPTEMDLDDRSSFVGDACPTGYIKVNGKCIQPD